MGPNVTHDIGALIDSQRTSGYQRWLVFLTALAIVFDGIDNQLLGVVIPTLMTEWGVARSAFAPVVSLGIAGMMVGGALAGIAGDRFGRRRALLASMTLFGVMTLTIATVHDISTLAALRFVAGIGLGGAIPNAATLAAEFVSRAQRPMAVTATIVCVPLGAMLAGVLGSQVLSTTSWRALFVAGGVIPLVAAVVLARLLPESPRFLARYPARWPELVRLARKFGHEVPPNATFEDSAEATAGRAGLASLFSPASVETRWRFGCPSAVACSRCTWASVGCRQSWQPAVSVLLLRATASPPSIWAGLSARSRAAR